MHETKRNCNRYTFADATHVKACANRKKYKNILVAKKQARFYDEALKKEIDSDRSLNDKKPLKDKDDNDDFTGGVSSEENNEIKIIK